MAYEFKSPRTVTVFSIEDPESTETIADIVLKHEPLTQHQAELRLRAVAQEFGHTWAELGEAISEDSPKVDELMKRYGFELVKEFPFFKVAGETKIKALSKADQGLLGKIAEAAVEPTEGQKIDELVSFVQDNCINEDTVVERLDEIVHDRKGSEAADINNGGLASQIEYLCAGMSLEAAKKWLKENALPPTQ